MDEDKDDISELNINIARVLNVEVWAGAVRGPGGLSDSQTNGIKIIPFVCLSQVLVLAGRNSNRNRLSIWREEIQNQPSGPPASANAIRHTRPYEYATGAA